MICMHALACYRLDLSGGWGSDNLRQVILIVFNILNEELEGQVIYQLGKFLPAK